LKKSRLPPSVLKRTMSSLLAGRLARFNKQLMPTTSKCVRWNWQDYSSTPIDPEKAFSGQLLPQDPNDEPTAELLVRIKVERVVNKVIIKFDRLVSVYERATKQS